MHFFFIFSSLVAAGSAASLLPSDLQGLEVRSVSDNETSKLTKRGACIGKPCIGNIDTKSGSGRTSSPTGSRRVQSTTDQGADRSARQGSTTEHSQLAGQPSSSRSSSTEQRQRLATIASQENLMEHVRLLRPSTSVKYDAEGRAWSFNKRIAEGRAQNAAVERRSVVPPLVRRGGCLGKVCMDPGAEEHRRPRIRKPNSPVILSRGKPSLASISPTQPLPGSLPVSRPSSSIDLSRDSPHTPPRQIMRQGSPPSSAEPQPPFGAPRDLALPRSPTPYPRSGSSASVGSPGKATGNSPARSLTQSERNDQDMLVPDAGSTAGSSPR